MRQLLTGIYAPAAVVTSLTGGARNDRARQTGEHLLRVAAVLAVTGPGSVGSHDSAARVYELGVLGHGPASLLEITRARRDQGSRTGRPGVRVHVAALPPDHVVKYRGVPLTSVPRTVVDLARVLPFAEGVAVADSALHATLTSQGELSTIIADCPRWPGIQRARDVSAFSDSRSESVLESLGRAAFHPVRPPASRSAGLDRR
jgi:hypothetical protein